MQQDKWIDITATISNGMVRWPTDPAVDISKAEKIGVKSSEANVTKLCTTAHVGTHIDAPLHFYKDGADVASIDVNRLIGKAKVIRIANEKEISYDEIKNHPIEEGDRILFHTRNSDTDWEREPFNENYVYLSMDAAKYLVNKKVTCVGVDYLSVGSKDEDPEVHRLMLGVPVVIIEGLKLAGIEAGEYDMICLPLKIQNSDGGPSRVVIKPRL